jgi:predicted phage terminase large subunit-like protein
MRWGVPLRRPPSSHAGLRGWAQINPEPFNFGALAQPTQPDAARVHPDYGVWLAKNRPQYRWDARHFRVMQRELDAVTAGTERRVYFQIPIRHGKSEHNTIGYAVYRLLLDPTTRILLCSYSDTKAQEFSRETRRLAVDLGVELSKDRNSAGSWETTAGGGLKAVGAGAGVASTNADLILIDDPIGSRTDAESQAKRDQVWDWITNDILARCEPKTAVIMTMSRWHQDDPAGRLLEKQRDRWTVIDLPAEAEENDPLGRVVGEPLWPELRGAEWLDEVRQDVLAYGFASLLQGRPRPREGGMFKWAWWQIIDEVPLSGPMIRYWDLAGTEPKGKGHDPDYSAGALMCRMADLRVALCDVARDRKSIHARDQWLAEVCAADLAKYRGRISWWIETEAGIAGEERTAQLVRRLQSLGMPVYTEHPTGKKIHRAEPLASKAEAGNCVLVDGAWNDPFRAEAADFPNGKHDDQIDAAAGADSKLTVRSTGISRTVYM